LLRQVQVEADVIDHDQITPPVGNVEHESRLAVDRQDHRGVGTPDPPALHVLAKDECVVVVREPHDVRVGVGYRGAARDCQQTIDAGLPARILGPLPALLEFRLGDRSCHVGYLPRSTPD
jgi:hypothetical protein